jgi:tRNA(Ile)-lysidine synthase
MISIRLKYILQQIGLSGFTNPILVGISGGPDSLCLLDILHRAGYPLIIAHLNHGLRPEAEADARMVKQLAADLGVEFVLGKEDVNGFALENKLSIEEAARFLRYRFLFSQARQYAVQAVAVAHTANDQVETILMHLLRGTGLSGLKGMSYVTLPNAWSQDIPLIRPMLSTWREEIVQYCQEHHLQPVQDKTNLDTTYYRNRLRHELIPYLENYNPQVCKLLWRTAQTLAGDDEIVEQAVASAWKDCIGEQGPGYVFLSLSVLLKFGKGLQRRLVRQAIDRARPGLLDIGFETIDRVIGFITSPCRSANLSLVGGLYLLIEGDRLWVAARGAALPDFEWPQAPRDKQIELNVPGEVTLPNGWRLKTEPVRRADLPFSYHSNQDAFQAWLSSECLQQPLIIRSRLPGDRFQPLGMDGRAVKLSDFMINAQLPRRARSAWPLVCSNEEIAWIPGMRISQQFRIVENTHQIVHIQLVKIEQG